MNQGRISSHIPGELCWLLPQIRPFLHLHLGSFLCITAGSALALLTPLVLKWMIDRIIPERRPVLLLVAMTLIVVGSLGKTAVTSLGSYLMMTAAQRMSLDLRMGLLRHLDSLSADYYDKTPTGTVLYPFREPIDEIAGFASDLVPAILRMLLTTVFTFATMLALSPRLTFLIVPFIPVFLLTRQHFRKRLASDSDQAQLDRISWSNYLEEHFAAVIPIQLLVQNKRQERRAFRLLALVFRSQEKVFRTGVWFTLYTSIAIVSAMSVAIGYGGWRVAVGALTLGSLVAFYSFVTTLFDPLSGAAELYSRAQKMFASIRQVQAAFAVQPSIVDVPGMLFAPPASPEIEFVGVEFGYSRRRRTLRIQSLRIEASEKLAIAGENGAGKSTLAKLIPRLYDVDRGAIRIAGEDIRNIRMQTLRRYVCYVPREPVLFDGTLAFNIKFVRPSTSDRELADVISTAGVGELVGRLPDGIDQRIGPAGCQLSGGERQRLAIARAILQRPKILILDEATSCLDGVAEKSILATVLRCLGDSTVIVVSHRETTLSVFSRVILLSRGELASDGTTNDRVWPESAPLGLS